MCSSGCLALVMSPSWRSVAEVVSTSHAWQGKFLSLYRRFSLGLEGWTSENKGWDWLKGVRASLQKYTMQKELEEMSMARNALLTSGEALLWEKTHWLVGSPRESPFAEYEENFALIGIGVNYFPVLQRRHQEDINDLCDERRDEMGKSLPRKVKTPASCSSGFILAGIVWYRQCCPDGVLYSLKFWWGWYLTCSCCMWYRQWRKLMKSQEHNSGSQSKGDSTADGILTTPHCLLDSF